MNMFRWAMPVLMLVALYALFAGSMSISEAVAGAVSVGCAVFYAWLTRRAAPQRFAFRPAWLGVLPRLGWSLVRDTAAVGVALLASIFLRSEGNLVRQTFAYGDASRESAARRALVILGVSLAPNGYVIRAPAEGEFLLVHRLVPARTSTDARWPL
jgi:multisubunit Na+/H+ antiporter MnhE subunit